MSDFEKALENFKKAVRELSQNWYGDVIGYPKYLPSFDEFVNDIIGMEIKK